MNGVPADDYVDDSTIQPLPQDGDTPFGPASPVSDEAGGTPEERAEEVQKLDSTHPSTDANIQPEEVYEEGLPGAAEATEPNVADKLNHTIRRMIRAENGQFEKAPATTRQVRHLTPM